MGHALQLLATSEVSRAAVRHLQRSSSLRENWYLVVVVLAIIAFWAGLYFWDRYRQQAPQSTKSPKPLFQLLCDAHRLDRAERMLLLKVVEARGASPEAVVFVDPQMLDGFCTAEAADAAEFRTLAAKLFGPRNFE
jgi:hypothetical protein